MASDKIITLYDLSKIADSKGEIPVAVSVEDLNLQ